MLGGDLAVTYDVKARRLREQINGNAEQFPNHFMFQLNQDEANFLVSRNAVPESLAFFILFYDSLFKLLILFAIS